MKKESILFKKIIILICTFTLLFLLMGCNGIIPGANSDSQMNAVVKLIDVPINMWWQDVSTYTGLSTGVNLAVGESRDFFAQINVANDKVVWMELTHFELK